MPALFGSPSSFGVAYCVVLAPLIPWAVTLPGKGFHRAQLCLHSMLMIKPVVGLQGP